MGDAGRSHPRLLRVHRCRALPAANYSAGCPSLDEIDSAPNPSWIFGAASNCTVTFGTQIARRGAFMRCGRAGDGNLAESCHLRHPCELRLPYLGNAQTVTVCQSL